jgi:hypothetical protein
MPSMHLLDEHRREFGYGDVWSWTALRAGTKLVPRLLIGSRDAVTNRAALSSARRINHRSSEIHTPQAAAHTAAPGWRNLAQFPGPFWFS